MPSTHSQNVLLTTCLCLVWAGVLRGQTPDGVASHQSVGKLTNTKVAGRETDVQHLIESLGDPSFEVRERSTAALLEIGPIALPHLKHLAPHASKEARQRALSVQTEIEKRYLVATSRAFLVDADSRNSHGLPAWSPFSQLVGASRSSKMLYLEMLKSNYEMAQQIDELAKQQAAGSGTAEFQIQFTRTIGVQASNHMSKIFQGGNIGIGDAVAILLAVAVIDSTAPVEASEMISYCVQRGFYEYLSKPGFRPCLIKLLSQWVPKTHGAFAPEVLRLGFTLELPVVLPIARQHMSDTFDKNTREFAIYCVAKYGNRSDVPSLLKLTHDTTIIHEFNDSRGNMIILRANPPGLPRAPSSPDQPLKLVRINDLATVASMTLMNEDPSRLFPQFTREAFFRRDFSILAVEQDDADERTEIIKAWAAEHFGASLND